MPRLTLEVAVETPGDVLAAVAGGADRLELSSALPLGGLTPTLGLYHEASRLTSLPIVVMLRPRAGDFVYTDDEFRVLERDLDGFLPYRPAGFVFGALSPTGDIDPRCGELVRRAGVPCVFHRAFDACRDPFAAADAIAALGFARVLTSGQRPTAREGADLIRQLRELFPSLEWLPGGKVRAENVRAVVERTGCDQVHGAFTASNGGTSRELVAAARAVLDAM